MVQNTIDVEQMLHFFNVDPRTMREDLDVALTKASIPIPVHIDRSEILGMFFFSPSHEPLFFYVLCYYLKYVQSQIRVKYDDPIRWNDTILNKTRGPRSVGTCESLQD